MGDTKDIPLSAELVRKGIHLFALVIPIGYYLVPFPIAIICVSISAVVSILIDVARFRRWKLWKWLSVIITPIIRKHEVDGGFTGASYILTTSVLCMILFPKPVAMAALVFIIIGDTAAALIGRLYGKHKLIGSKTIEGSSACLLSTALVSLLVPGLPLAAGLCGAVVATVAEALSGSTDDNLTVPISSGFAMLAVMWYLGSAQARLFESFL